MPRPAALVVSFVVSGARADAVGPPPASCPPGSTPTSSHAGPICTPIGECDPSAPCAGGDTCTTVRQCVEQRACGGRIPPDSGPCFVEHVVGACQPDGTCGLGTCRTRNVCASGGGTSSGGCGCVVGARPRAHGATLAVLLVGAALARRRASARSA